MRPNIPEAIDKRHAMIVLAQALRRLSRAQPGAGIDAFLRGRDCEHHGENQAPAAPSLD
jgi:hypothetical protein